MARMKARHSSDIAKRSTPDEMQGLQPVIFLAKGAHVILTMSLWTNAMVKLAPFWTVYMLLVSNLLTC